MQTKLQELSYRLFEQQKQKPVECSRQRGLIYEYGEAEQGLRMLIDGIEIYMRGQKQQYRNAPVSPCINIISALRQLLNEPGDFDVATCLEALRLIEQEVCVGDSRKVALALVGKMTEYERRLEEKMELTVAEKRHLASLRNVTKEDL